VKHRTCAENRAIVHPPFKHAHTRTNSDVPPHAILEELHANKAFVEVPHLDKKLLDEPEAL